MDRRRFLQLVSSAAASSAMLGCRDDAPALPITGWGIPSDSQAGLLVPMDKRPEAVVELFLMGGLCPWDTFYVVPEFGTPDDPDAPNSMWHTFQTGDDSVPEFAEICGVGADMLHSYARAGGRDVFLGPWLQPLKDRPDVFGRMRVFVMSHQFEPHDAATPLALSGQPRGTPRMATTGAHVQRFRRALEGPGRTVPYAYTLFSSNSEIEAQFDINSASAAGLHSAAVKPLHLRLTEDSALPSQLERAHLLGADAAVDDVRDAFVNRYARGLSRGHDAPLHSARGLDELMSAFRALRFSRDLSGVLTPEALTPQYGTECQTVEPVLDDTAMGFELARHLVTSPVDPARYVLCVDSGLVDATGAGYDTHDNHVRDSARNVTHAMRRLVAMINEPGENDPTKLDLDRHLILLTTEFGRTPYPETGKPLGLDHWPFGYVVVAFGGPIEYAGNDDFEQRAIVGAIDGAGYATESLSPAELRAAILSVQGIWPFSPESFAIGDIPGANSEADAARHLLEKVWGFV